MNISATAAMGYTYTNIKTGVSQKKDVSNENTCEKHEGTCYDWCCI